MDSFQVFQLFTERMMLNLSKGAIIPEDVCCLGLAGELGEVCQQLADGPMDCKAMQLELGDLLWYITALGWHFDVKLADLYADGDLELGMRMDASLSLTALRLTAALGAVCDHLKKVRWSQGIEADPALVRRNLRRAVAAIRTIAYQHGASMCQVLDMNVAKLKARHGEVYQGGEGNRAAG